jgi:3-hydroxyisobutyrate dehydrogenase-like beta-hydroxyacid dehydrogenase
MLEVRGPAMLAGEYEPAAMRVELFGKDLDIITSFAQAVGSPTPLFSASAPFYDTALAQGRGHQDTACVFAVLDAADPR